jgi:hypothetical protein
MPVKPWPEYAMMSPIPLALSSLVLYLLPFYDMARGPTLRESDLKLFWRRS